MRKHQKARPTFNSNRSWCTHYRWRHNTCIKLTWTVINLTDDSSSIYYTKIRGFKRWKKPSPKHLLTRQRRITCAYAFPFFPCNIVSSLARLVSSSRIISSACAGLTDRKDFAWTYRAQKVVHKGLPSLLGWGRWSRLTSSLCRCHFLLCWCHLLHDRGMIAEISNAIRRTKSRPAMFNNKKLLPSWMNSLEPSRRLKPLMQLALLASSFALLVSSSAWQRNDHQD